MGRLLTMSQRKPAASKSTPFTGSALTAIADYERESYARVLANNPAARARHLLFAWSGSRALAWRMEDYLVFTGNAEADAQRALNRYWAEHGEVVG